MNTLVVAQCTGCKRIQKVRADNPRCIICECQLFQLVAAKQQPKPVKKKSRKTQPKPEKPKRQRPIGPKLTPKYHRYRQRAQAKNLAFEILQLEFIQITRQPCRICGSTEHIGIDRINSAKGYTRDNVQPCCKHCNWMKRDLSMKEFIRHVKKIATQAVDNTA